MRNTDKYYPRKCYKNSRNAKNARKKWTNRELNILFSGKYTDAELEKRLKRSRESIHVARCKYRHMIVNGKMPKRETKWEEL